MTTPSDGSPAAGGGLSAELGAERTYHEACRAALSAMGEDAADRVAAGENAFASGADAEVLGYQLRSHAKELREEPDSPLFFGRLTFGTGAPATTAGRATTSAAAGSAGTRRCRPWSSTGGRPFHAPSTGRARGTRRV